MKHVYSTKDHLSTKFKMYQIQGFQFCLPKTKQKNKREGKRWYKSNTGFVFALCFPISVIYQTEDA